MNYRLHLDLVFFSFFFSVLFCGLCALVDSLLGFWVFLELCGMSLVPSFFYSSCTGLQGFYGSLLSYVVVSGLSSVLIVSGIIFFGLYYLVLLGFVLKFGLFPFSLWVYRVFSGSNWFFIFLLSVVSKFPILFFCFLLQSGCDYIMYFDCFLTLLMCSLFFWFFSNSWEFVWCHVSLSSISTLIIACFCSDFTLCFFIYFYYSIWSSFCVLYFYALGSMSGVKNNFWWYCFLLLITPLSFPLFYKLSVCLAIINSCLYVVLIWSVYSFSEQIFLYKLGSDYFYSTVYNDWLC
uniref:NADH dehydrogenase subunit 2 n=1 Tax=Rhinebothrium sp. 1 TaxID=108307 RepID=A0A8K1W4W9_9CEST|nr:NADH dehydrogenase subunit 2 [Rhinebothrium sp. 1]UFQ88668.1 NADH dehydrogenase subunit 2 [Rhinebothrium sp. 1]UFQ88680.1 NADH dehydrogenase subunit 2 [Rhinebothrium sp. 1]UFQ88692.1 NADH dehydrogenase subunit 2 [Rhinebothrium sp. 1]